MYETLLVTKEEGVYLITLNRPKKRNALTFKGYFELADALRQGCADPNFGFIAITGQGSFYSSGNDITNFLTRDAQFADPQEPVRTLVKAFIDTTKPVIALVNGPAIGIMATTLGLCDTVYATESAYLLTPFSSLGLCAEGCASYIFPKVSGYQKANEMLLWNQKVSARDACNMGLVSQVFPDGEFQKEVKERLLRYSKLPKGSLRATKMLTRQREVDLLHRVNEEECRALKERGQSEEAAEAVLAFMNRKSKL